MEAFNSKLHDVHYSMVYLQFQGNERAPAAGVGCASLCRVVEDVWPRVLILLRDSTHFNDFHGDPELKFQLWMHDAEAKADLATFFVYRLFVGCYNSSI